MNDFGIDYSFWYRLHVLVPTVHFGTSRLFWYRPFISIPLTYSSTDHLNRYRLYSKVETGIFGSSYPARTWMKPPLAQGISHLEGHIQTSTRIRAQD